MSTLNVTLIDVGWGDSILIESMDNNNYPRFALIDSNDTANYQSSLIFIKRYLERMHPDVFDRSHLFDLVVLSHAHSDHGQGLKAIMKMYGTERFWYPKSTEWGSQVYLIEYAKRSNKVVQHEAVNSGKDPIKIGDVEVSIFWPDYNGISRSNENNNSIVLLLRLDAVSVLLTGDAEEEVWEQIANNIPQDTLFFKVPHHGSVNGTFDNHGNSAWFDALPNAALLGMSTHIRPFEHPDPQVVDLFNQNGRSYYRTDEHYHITFSTTGNNYTVKYSHV